MINIILFSLFHLSLVAFIIYVARFKLSSYSKDFNSLVKVFILLIVVCCILIYCRITTPIALLYGPIHLALYKISIHKPPKKYMLLHLLPFFLMLVFYFALYYSVQTKASWSDTLFIYYPTYFICTIVSSIGYNAYIGLTKWKVIYNHLQKMLVLQLTTVALVIGVFITISLLILWGRLDKANIGFDAIHIVCGLLLLCAGFMISYLVTDRRESNKTDNLLREPVKLDNAKYYTNNIDKDVFKEYALILERVINDKKLYLNSGLSLDDLSVETDIPKHHLSQLLNIHIGKSFYQYIAERRIQEAVFRIQEDGNITLESLAYECGFNSKTSFNKYFKDITGTTPSDYRSKSELVE